MFGDIVNYDYVVRIEQGQTVYIETVALLQRVLQLKFILLTSWLKTRVVPTLTECRFKVQDGRPRTPVAPTASIVVSDFAVGAPILAPHRSRPVIG